MNKSLLTILLIASFRLGYGAKPEEKPTPVEQKNITQSAFDEFPLSNGFSKGDVIFVWGRFTPKVGDIIIFQQKDSSAPNPIIHRIVSIENGIFQTKGDHNSEQLIPSNNPYNTDETNITEDEIIGKAIFKFPYLGYPKIWLRDLVNSLLN